MKKEALQALSTEQLQKKKSSLRTLNGIFIGLILALSFFVIRDYLAGGEFDWAITTITICTLGGLASVYQEFQQVKAELVSRN